MTLAPVRLADTAVLGWLRPDAGWLQRTASLASSGSRFGAGWIAISAGLAVRRGRTRHAAAAGLAGWAAASSAAFGLKSVVDRQRPRWPAAIGARPRTSSMPSSHTAGATGYVAAAFVTSPPVGAALAPVAGLVAWSRVATARHFPGDVAVAVLLGVTLGTGVGVAVRRWTQAAEQEGEVIE